MLVSKLPIATLGSPFDLQGYALGWSVSGHYYHLIISHLFKHISTLQDQYLPNSNRLSAPKLALRALKLRFQHRTLSSLYSLDSLRQ